MLKAKPKKNVRPGKKDGRPTKYHTKYCQEIIDFFNVPPYTFYKDKKGDLVLDKWGKPIKIPSQLPIKEMFAYRIGVNKDTLVEWRKVHKEFDEAVTQAEFLQKNMLLQNGLDKLWDPKFTMFVAINITDMKKDVELPPPPSPTTINLNINTLKEKTDEELLAITQELVRPQEAGGKSIIEGELYDERKQLPSSST